VPVRSAGRRILAAERPFHQYEDRQSAQPHHSGVSARPPRYSAPVTNIIKIDWVLQFKRAKTVFDEILKGRIWTNDASKQRLREFLRKLPSTAFTFGDLTRPVAEIDKEWVNSRPVFSSLAGTSGPDGLFAALGNFELHVAVAGKVLASGYPGAW